MRWKVWWKRPPRAFIALMGLLLMAMSALLVVVYALGSRLVDVGVGMMEID